jgi:hypothetical protein
MFKKCSNPWIFHLNVINLGGISAGKKQHFLQYYFYQVSPKDTRHPASCLPADLLGGSSYLHTTVGPAVINNKVPPGQRDNGFPWPPPRPAGNFCFLTKELNYCPGLRDDCDLLSPDLNRDLSGRGGLSGQPKRGVDSNVSAWSRLPVVAVHR